jgi:hypothetical protein
MPKKISFSKVITEKGAFSGLPPSKGEFKPAAQPDKHKTNPVEQPAFKMPTSDAPRKPLKASADASKFLRKIGPQTKLDTPFDKANKEVDKMAAGVHKDTTSVVGRMKGAGIPLPKAGYKAPSKPDSVDKLSPNAKGYYQDARAFGKSVTTLDAALKGKTAGMVHSDNDLDRPTIWRNQEKAASGLGQHDYDVAKHGAPAIPKAKTDPIASQSPQGPGSDPIASQKTSKAPVETPAPSAGSSSMADNPAPKTQAEPAPAIGMTKPGESNPLNKSKKERQTTPRGNKVAGEPEGATQTPPPLPPPLPKPPPVPPPAPKAAPEPKAINKDHSKAASYEKAAGQAPKPKKVKSHYGRSIVGAVTDTAKNIAGQAGKFIKSTTRVRNYTR